MIKSSTLLSALCLLAAPAMAQQPPMGNAANVPIAAEVPTPSTDPEAPDAPAVGTASYFPPLPQSRLCKTEEMAGVWKLQMVYENPLGQGAIGFSAQPYQYLTLNADGTYTEYKTNYPEDESTIPARLLNQRAGSMQQYLVNETGFIYFYRDSVATDTQACFMVAAAKGQFIPGEMLLMPPEGTTNTRLVKIYKRLTPAPVIAAPPAVRRPNAVASQHFTKPRGVRRRQDTNDGMPPLDDSSQPNYSPQQ